MKIKLKKYLAIIFILSLLLDFGSSIVSLAAEESCLIGNREDYIKSVTQISDIPITYEVIVDNNKVAQHFGINPEQYDYQEKNESLYILVEQANGFFIQFMGNLVPVWFVPDVFLGKPATINNFSMISWQIPSNDQKRMLCVPLKLKDLFKMQVGSFFLNINLRSYDEVLGEIGLQLENVEFSSYF